MSHLDDSTFVAPDGTRRGTSVEHQGRMFSPHLSSSGSTRVK